MSFKQLPRVIQNRHNTSKARNKQLVHIYNKVYDFMREEEIVIPILEEEKQTTLKGFGFGSKSRMT